MGKIVPFKKPVIPESRPIKDDFIQATRPPVRRTKEQSFFAYQPKRRSGKIVSTLDDLKRLSNKMKHLEEFAYDTECNTIRVYGENKFFKLVGISISWGIHHNYYIPVGHVREEDADRQLDLETVVKYLKPCFERTDVRIIGANLKFDMHVMARIGINIRTKDLFDTQIASWLCDENSPNGLKDNTEYYLGFPQTHFSEVMATIPNEIKKAYGFKSNAKGTIDLTLIDDCAPYALDDAFYTFQLYLGFLDLLEYEGMHKIYRKLYVPLQMTVFKMEEHGVTVDLDRLKEMSDEIKADMEALVYRMYEIAGVEFNPGSDQQLGELLFAYQKPVKDPRTPWDGKGKKPKRQWEDFTEKERATKIREYEAKLIEKENSPLMKVSYAFRVISETDGGAPQVNATVLWKLSNLNFANKHKKEGVLLCKLLMEWKKLEKLNSAFIDGLKDQLYDDGKVHPSFNITGTDSGRFSCSEPNLQQLPKAEEEDKYQIRSLFIGSLYALNTKTGEIVDDPDEVDRLSHVPNWIIKRKKIVAIDYSNLEVRVNAHFSEDENLLKMFANGDDVHGSTAVNMFELDCVPNDCKKKYPHLRQVGKVLNFLLIYGGGAPTLYDKLKEDRANPIDLGDKKYLKMYNCRKGVEVAQIYIDKYFDSYKGVARFIRQQKKFAHKNGYVLTLLRRKRRLPDINCSDFKIASYCERLSVNSPVQGSAADITNSAMNRVDAESWFDEHRCFMLLQVHDEIVFECPEEYVEEAIPIAQKLMEHPFGEGVELNLALRADADFGDSYQEAK